MTKDDAADKLMKVFAEQYYGESYREIVGLLNDPVAYGAPSKDYEPISKWYKSLPEEQQRYVKFLVEDAVLAPIHSLLVLFDGATGAPELDDKLVSVGLQLNLFEDDEDGVDGMPVGSFDIGELAGGQELHDLFMSHVDEIRPTFG